MIINRGRYEEFWKCPRAYYWTYIRNLTVARAAPELRVGAAVHKFLELWHQLTPAAQIVHVGLEPAIEEAKKNFNASLHQFTGLALQQQVEDKFLAQVELLCRDYVARYPTESEYQIIDTELQGDAELPDGHTLRFRVDGLAAHDKMVWVWENKTTRTLGPQFLDSFLFNNQIILYVYGTRKVLKQKIAGAIINMLRKPTDVPKQTSAFHRQHVPVTQEHMKSAMLAVAHTANLIERTDPNDIYQWPQITKECGRCPFQQICANGAEPVAPLYIPRGQDYVDIREFDDSIRVRDGGERPVQGPEGGETRSSLSSHVKQITGDGDQ